MKSILDYYLENVAKQEGMKYIFLDEMQYISNWQEIVKFWYDLDKNINFVVTWSTSLYIYDSVKESLAGRLVDFKLQPLLFDEYLHLKWFDIEKTDIGLEFHDLILTLNKQVAMYKSYFSKYLISWEFPQIMSNQDDDIVSTYFQNSILDKILWYDIDLFNIEKKDEIKKLYYVLSSMSWSFLNKQNISRDLWISKPTLNKYFVVLQKSFLINITNNFLRSLLSQEKSYKKLFYTSVNLLNYNLWITDFEQFRFEDAKGHVIENYIYNRLIYLYWEEKVYYYFKNQLEVDFVVDLGNIIIPIEVKIKKAIKNSDVRGLITFMKKNNCKTWYIFYAWNYDIKTINWYTIHCLCYVN